MTRRTAKTRLERSAFVDADGLSGADIDTPLGSARGSRRAEASTSRTRQRKSRAMALDARPRSLDDDPDEYPTTPRMRASARSSADGGGDSSPRRSSPRSSSSRWRSADGAAPGSEASPLVVPSVTLPHDGDPGDSHSGLIPDRRSLVSAHRVTRKETALVVRQTHKVPGLTQTTTTKAVTVVGPGGSETVVLPAPKRPAATAVLPVFAPSRPSGRRRHPITGMLVAIMIGAVLLAALYTISPLSPFSPLRGHDSAFAPSAALLALNPVSNVPAGPWETSAGTTTALGQGGGAGPGVSAPGSAGLPVSNSGGAWNFSASPGVVFISAPPVSPWPPDDPFMAVPGHLAFRVSGPGGFYPGAFGQCTWWAAFQRRDENLSYLGDAHYWATGAAARGYQVGHVAAPNSTVVFRGGVEGAGGAGHVAHVEAVYPGGWFLVSEMNFYWNGGGWGRVDYRFAHEGYGVAFIY